SNIKLIYDFDFQGARIQALRALDLNPNSSPAHVHYALGLEALGQFEETFAELDLAENLDPLGTGPTTAGQWAAFFARDYERAITYGQRVFQQKGGLARSDPISKALYGLAKVQKSGGK